MFKDFWTLDFAKFGRFLAFDRLLEGVGARTSVPK